METDEKYMRRALQLAAKGEGHVSPNPMVGCVIVAPGGEIIGEGWHRQFGGPHAEVNAINSVRDKNLLRDCTLYVTLEPCSHFGKTPPCANLIADCGIPRVVVGAPDPFSEVSGRGIRRLREAGIDVSEGMMKEECIALNRKFMTAHTSGRPYICLKWAQDAAGIMGDTDKRLHISNSLSRMYVHKLRSGYDAILAGSRTIMADNPRLDVRFWPGNSPRPVVFGPKERYIDLNIADNPRTLFLPHGESLADSLNTLYNEYKITSLLVEGGATLLKSFINEGLWDEIRQEISPRSLGGNVIAPKPVGQLASVEEARGNIICTFLRVP